MSEITTNRTAIVTGGASGIGLAISERLAAEGITVAVFDRNDDAGNEAASKIAAAGGRAIALSVDVTDRTRLDAAVQEVRDRLGSPTILVNNAGLDYFGSFLKIHIDEWRRILELNLTGTFQCCQAVIPHMLDAGWGRIVNISSSSAQGGTAYMAPYVSAKAGVIGLTKGLALEFRPKGITVNTIPPGFIDTPMLRAAAENPRRFGGVSIEQIAGQTPVRRAGRPEDIAAMCAFLVREEASYITGQVLGVNGGRNT